MCVARGEHRQESAGTHYLCCPPPPPPPHPKRNPGLGGHCWWVRVWDHQDKAGRNQREPKEELAARARQSDGGEEDAVGEQRLGGQGSPRKQVRSPAGPAGVRGVSPWSPLHSSPSQCSRRLWRAVGCGRSRACPCSHGRVQLLQRLSPSPELPWSSLSSHRGLLIMTADKELGSDTVLPLTARAWGRCKCCWPCPGCGGLRPPGPAGWSGQQCPASGSTPRLLCQLRNAHGGSGWPGLG